MFLSPLWLRLAQVVPMGEAEAPVDVEAPATSRSVGFCDIAKHFVLMGWTAFGGPAAHVGLFQKTFVERREGDGEDGEFEGDA